MKKFSGLALLASIQVVVAVAVAVAVVSRWTTASVG